jgi:Tfp pilus assembly protein PilO
METGLEGKPWFYGAGGAVVIAGIVIAGGYYFKFQKMNDQIDRQEQSLRDLQEKIREGEAAQAQLPQFMEEVERLQLELDKLLRILPPKRKTEDLLRRIRNLTEQGDFLLVRFDPRSVATQDDFYSAWPIQIELEGTYHNLALFFDRISRFSRIINVDNLRIDPKNSPGTNHTIRANFLAKTFLSNEPEPEGDS